MAEYSYKIGETTYTQKPLVLGQYRLLMNLLKGINIPSDFDIIPLVTALGDKLSQAIAIVLNPIGIPLKDKNIEELTTEIEFEIDPDTVFTVVTDFFVCNDLPSLLKKMNKVIE